MGVIENMREVADLVKKIGDLELNRKIVNLESEVHDLKRSNMRLETDLSEAQKLLKMRQELKFTEPFYYAEGDGTPFCTACWSAKDIAVHLHCVFDHEDAIRWDCPHCKHMYRVEKKVRSNSAIIGFGGPGGPQGWMR